MSVINSLPVGSNIKVVDTTLSPSAQGYYSLILENGDRATLSNCVPLGITCATPAANINYGAIIYTGLSSGESVLGARILKMNTSTNVEVVMNAGNVRFVFAYIPK